MMTFWDKICVVTLANLHIISVLHTADLCLVNLTVSVLDCHFYRRNVKIYIHRGHIELICVF